MSASPNASRATICGPPGVYRLSAEVCIVCTEEAGGRAEQPETHVLRECVTQWLGTYYGTLRFFECLHTEDEGWPGTVSVERYAILRASAEAVTDLYDAYVEADLTANTQYATEADEADALTRWGEMKQRVRDRHQADSYAGALRWTLAGTR